MGKNGLIGGQGFAAEIPAGGKPGPLGRRCVATAVGAQSRTLITGRPRWKR